MRASRLRLGMRRMTLEQMQQALVRRLGIRKKLKQRVESRGRPVGAVEGRWVTDLTEIKQLVTLCDTCDPKFSPSAAKYGYSVKREWMAAWGGVTAQCDGCREFGFRRKPYAHGSLIDKI